MYTRFFEKWNIFCNSQKLIFHYFIIANREITYIENAKTLVYCSKKSAMYIAIFSTSIPDFFRHAIPIEKSTSIDGGENAAHLEIL